MSTRTGVLPGRRAGSEDTGASIRPPVGRRDRRTMLLVASVAVVGASIAGFSALYASADHKVPAVVVVRSVAQGQPITSADLGQAQVAVSGGVAFLPLDQVATVSGKRAAVALSAGTLLTAADLAAGPALGAGDAVVGVALKDGFFPSGGLSPGDQVLVVQTAAPGSSIAAPAAVPSGSAAVPSGSTATGTVPTGVPGVSLSGTTATGSGVLVPQASVFAVTAPAASSSGGGALLVSLDVPASVAAQVATAAAAGQIGLVLLPHPGAATTTVAP